jgi:hypothetical protein
MPIIDFEGFYQPNANGTNEWISSGTGWYPASTYANVNQYPTLDTSTYNYARSDQCVDSFGTNINLPRRNWQSFIVEVYAWAGFSSVFGCLAIESTPPCNAWVANNQYYKGDTVLPTNPGGLQFRCLNSGMSSSVEPTWPTAIGVTYQDGSVTWVADPRLYFGTVYPNPIDIHTVNSPRIQLGVQDSYFGLDQQLLEGWRKVGERWVKNPQTGNNWTYNEMRYIRIGYRYQPRPGEGQIRIAQLYLRVLGTYLVP